MSRTERTVVVRALFGLLLLANACGGGGGGDAVTQPDPPPQPPPPPPPTTASFAGSASDKERNGAPISGARVTIAGLSATVTTDTDGRFTWPSAIPTGAYRVTVAAAGYDTLSQDIAIQSGNNFRPFQLVPVRTYIESGNTIVYLAPGVSTFRGAFLVVYGGTADSRPLLKGDLDFYQNLPPSGDVTGYRIALRTFAAEQRFALVGMKTPGVSEPASLVAADVLQALRDASVRGEHPELADATLLMQGMSNGGCWVNKLVSEMPNRVIGFVSMKFPDGCSFGNPLVASVPGYLFLGELDSPEINQAVTREFEVNRARGAPWALAVERGVGHVWVRQHALILAWAAEVAAQRLPAAVTPGSPVALRQVSESAGWLGDRTSFGIAESRCFPGNKLAASWLPSEPTARAWQSMMGSITTAIACP